MSFNDDCVVCCNNSINDNKLNAKKAKSSTVYQLKKIIKPLLAYLKKNKSTYKSNPQPEYFIDEFESEINDNIANEILENQIFEEIDTCEDFAAVQVYENGHMDIVPIIRGQRFIPVHFARTEAGTFFWTSTMGPDSDINCDGDINAISHHQLPELQVPCDRWAQA